MAANVGHILSLTVFAGAIAVMDLRMLGVFSATTPGLRHPQGATFAGFALLGMALTGSILFAAEASHVALNPVFQFKVALIVLGLLNVAYFEFYVKSRVANFSPLKPLPREAAVRRNCFADDLARGRGLRPEHRLLLTRVRSGERRLRRQRFDLAADHDVERNDDAVVFIIALPLSTECGR